jgi:hypothetical protein
MHIICLAASTTPFSKAIYMNRKKVSNTITSANNNETETERAITSAKLDQTKLKINGDPTWKENFRISGP